MTTETETKTPTITRKRRVPIEGDAIPSPRSIGSSNEPVYKAIRVKPTHREFKPLPPTERYWVGAFADAPFDNKSFGGVTFQKWTGTVQNDPKTGELIMDRTYPGNVIELDESQVEGVCKSVARCVIRTVGDMAEATGNYRCEKHDVSVHGYRPASIDRPAGLYIYMIKMEQLMPRDWRASRPPAMVELD